MYLPEPPAEGRGDQVLGLAGNLAAAVGAVRKEVSVLPQHLEASFRDFMGSMEVALTGIPSALAEFQVDEIELALELTVSGEVRLLAGASLEGKAGITLKLKRPPPPRSTPG